MAKKEQNYGDFHYFSYIAKNPSYGFATYKDPDSGQVMGYVEGYDKNNRPIYKYWHFNYDSQKIKRVGKNEHDLEKKSAYEFLKNAPACMGSKNGEFVGEKQTAYYYKEIDTAKDAKEAVDTRRMLIEAQKAAIDLSGQELEDIATLIGVFDPSEEVLRHRVLDYSSNQPVEFLKLIKDSTVKVRSLIRKCVNKGVFKVEGKLIMWETKTLGNDEDEAVATLMKDEKLRKAVEANVARVG